MPSHEVDRDGALGLVSLALAMLTLRGPPRQVRENPSIKGWFSGHFHLSHDYEDSITFPGGNNRGS